MPQKIVDVDPSKPIATAAEEFRVAARSLIILLGAFDQSLNERTRSVFSRVVVPVAVEANALILDDAGTTGCAPLMAQATLDQDTVPTLIGVIRNDRTGNDIDPNHELVLRLPAVWSSQAKYWFQLAAGLAPDAASSTRVAALLFGGGSTEKQAVLWCARRGWPLLIVGKTGGLDSRLLEQSRPIDST